MVTKKAGITRKFITYRKFPREVIERLSSTYARTYVYTNVRAHECTHPYLQHTCININKHEISTRC